MSSTVIRVLAAVVFGTLTVLARAQGATEQSELFTRSLQHHETHVVELDGRVTSTYRVATQVLKPQAIEGTKQTTLSVSRTAQSLQVLEAYTLKPGGKRLAVPKSSWQVRQDTGQAGNSPIFSDYSSTTLVFPDVAVGDTLVLAYRLTTREPLFPGKFFIAGEFSKAFAFDDAKIVVDAPAAMALKTQVFGMNEAVNTKGNRKVHTWTYQNKSPSVETRRNWTVYDVGSQPGYLVSSFDSWEDVARSYVQRATPKAAVTQPIKELSNQLAAGKSDVREKVRAIHEWVATKVSYAGNCVGIGAVVPRDLDVVLKHRIGDCKDHATLLQALLAAQGIESHQVLVNAGNIYRLPQVPVASLVNHVINYVPALDLFIDSTDDMAPLGQLPFLLHGKPVLVADAKLPTRIPGPSAANTQVMKTVMTIGEDGSASGTVEVSLGGMYATSARTRLKGLTADQRKRFVSNLFRNASLEADGQFEHDDPAVMADQFRFKGSFTVKKILRYPGSGATPISPWFYNEAPVAHWAQQAVEPLDEVDVACSSGSTVEEYEITLPPKMEVVSLPQGTAFSSQLLNYEASYRLEGRELKVRRSLEDRSPPPVCSPDTMKAYKAGTEGVLADVKQQLLYK